jgi:hypothetical protein
MADPGLAGRQSQHKTARIRLRCIAVGGALRNCMRRSVMLHYPHTIPGGGSGGQWIRSIARPAQGRILPRHKIFRVS